MIDDEPDRYAPNRRLLVLAGPDVPASPAKRTAIRAALDEVVATAMDRPDDGILRAGVYVGEALLALLDASTREQLDEATERVGVALRAHRFVWRCARIVGDGG